MWRGDPQRLSDSALIVQMRFNKSEESSYIYPDDTVLPRKDLTSWDQDVLEDFDVPEGHRVLTRAKGPGCTQGYAVTREGAARLMFMRGLQWLGDPIDLEIMWLCHWLNIRCLEVSPVLVGIYVRDNEPGNRISDNDDNWRPEKLNPIGPHSVKAVMNRKLGSVLDKDS